MYQKIKKLVENIKDEEWSLNPDMKLVCKRKNNKGSLELLYENSKVSCKIKNDIGVVLCCFKTVNFAGEPLCKKLNAVYNKLAKDRKSLLENFMS